MINIIKIVLVSVLFISGNWSLDFESAKGEAIAGHKKILLNFCGSDWCGPCIKLKQDVFESEQFSKFAEINLVLLKADFPRLKKNQLSKDQQKKNNLLADTYNPKGKFPYTVLLSENGEILREWDGYQPSISQFIAEIKEVSKK